MTYHKKTFYQSGHIRFVLDKWTWDIEHIGNSEITLIYESQELSRDLRSQLLNEDMVYTNKITYGEALDFNHPRGVLKYWKITKNKLLKAIQKMI